MIIEGEIPLDDMEEEGPFGECMAIWGSLMKNNFT
jgi:UbiD family decarboxylase